MHQLTLAAHTRHDDEDDLTRIIQWLSPVQHEIDYFERDLAEQLAERHETSCEWILATPQYKVWTSCSTGSADSLFWISAIPGAGKTVLSAFLVDHLRLSSAADTSSVLFVMFKADDADKCTPLSAARTLTYQLFRSFNFQNTMLVKALHERRKRSGKLQALDYQSLWELFCAHIDQAGTAVIVVDALDECKEATIFVDSLLRLSQAAHAKILITSRREATLATKLDKHTWLHFGAEENHQDISLYLNTKIASNSTLSDPFVSERLLQHLTMKLADYLLQRANGLFLWASLVLKEVESQMTVEDILRTVEELPPDLAETYKVILQKLPVTRTSRPLCRPILRWLACAIRPLSVTEMWEILAFEIAGGPEEFLASERDVEHACGSLVNVVDGIMHLAHRSLTEYLCNGSQAGQPDPVLAEFSIDVSDASVQIVTSCIAYMDKFFAYYECNPEIKGRGVFTGMLKADYCFLEYALQYWLYHLSDVDIHTTDTEFLSKLIWGDRWLSWIEICFALDIQDLWSLTQQVETLLHWSNAGILGEITGPTLLASTSKWTACALELLEMYGSMLEEEPSAAQLIDTDLRSRGPLGMGFCWEPSASTSGLRRQRFCLHSGLFDKSFDQRDIAIHSISHKLKPPRYGGRRFGLFHVDNSRHALFMTSYESSVPELMCQDLRTGRSMTPIRQSKKLALHTRYYYEGSGISKGGRYLATLYRPSIDKTPNRNREFQLTVWEISELLDPSNASCTKWCRVVVSMSFESGFLGDCARPLAFDAQDTLHYLSSRTEIGPTNQCISARDSLIQQANVGALEDLRGFGYSADGQSLVTYHGHSKKLSRLQIEDMCIASATTLPALNAVIYCISHTGRYTVWRDTTADEPYYLHDFITKASRPLPESEQVSFPANLHLAFSRDEDCLFGVMTAPTASGMDTSYIAIWNPLLSEIHLTRSHQIPTVLGFSFTMMKEAAYLAMKSYWLEIDPSRLDLLADKARQQDNKILYVKSQISYDGSRLVVLSREPIK